MLSLNRILIPHDFSETSAAAARYGVDLAKRFGAELLFLHVGDQAHADFKTEFPLGLEEAVDAAARERMLKILSPQEEHAFHPELTVRSGSPANEIVKFAREADVDLIVMGTHGRGFMGHMMMGSVAEKVVRMAGCPVLTVRSYDGGLRRTSPEAARLAAPA